MPSLKRIKDHFKSVANIQKVTTSMKMVAAAKFMKADRVLRKMRGFCFGTRRFFERNPVRAEVKPRAVVALTSDRGLCGGLHSRVARSASKDLRDDGGDLICLGEKSKSLLAQEFRRSIRLVGHGFGHKLPTFRQASSIADRLIIGNKPPYDHVVIHHPRSINVMTNEVKKLFMWSQPVISTKTDLENRYELEIPDQDLLSYIEFNAASTVYCCLIESYVAEQAARVTAMANASKNAGKVKNQLVVTYNRLRQQLITKELIDIITGANFVHEKLKAKRR